LEHGLASRGIVNPALMTRYSFRRPETHSGIAVSSVQLVPADWTEKTNEVTELGFIRTLKLVAAVVAAVTIIVGASTQSYA
jgi:hypothetical protein